jgi:signal transduction histidine kinase
VENDPRLGRVSSHGRYSSKSLICVPLKVGDRVIGVLNANNKRKNEPLNEHDLHVLTVFAAHVSNNIERARLYDRLEKQAKELKGAYERLRVIDNVKSDFIINVSHEYRTPVTIILGYLELLKSSLTDRSHLEKVMTTMEAANRLSRLIDDSTELLRIDTGTIQFHFQVASPHNFLEELVRDFWPRFGDKGVDLTLDLPEKLPLVSMDMDRMTKAFEKLLDNALKFTPSGGFTRIEARPSEDGGIRVSVEDSGPGIDQGDRARIFERFEQGGDIMTEKPEGTGLGLPIAKSVITRHGGTIAMDETLNTGCRFIVTLPPAEKIEG